MDAMTDHDRLDDHDLQQICDGFAQGNRWTALASDVPLGARALRRWVMGKATGRVLTDKRDWSRNRSWVVDTYVRLRTATEPLLHALVR